MSLRKIPEIIDDTIKTVAVVGHVRPDGDCVGSVTGLYRYLTENFPALSVTPFLEEAHQSVLFLEEGIPVQREETGMVYDLAISVDVSDEERIGAGKEAFQNALKRVCIDHHKTNTGFADVNHIEPTTSSAAEVLFYLFDEEKISKKCAVSLYTGIIHDTGVFQYDCTHSSTLRAAAVLMEKGIDFPAIIRDSYVSMQYKEIKTLAGVVLDSVFLPEERFLYAKASLDFQKAYGVNQKELGGIVSELAKTEGAECVLFIYQLADGTWKGSLRSKECVDCAETAAYFGGGGHTKAAGFNVEKDPDSVIEKVRELIRKYFQ